MYQLSQSAFILRAVDTPTRRIFAVFCTDRLPVRLGITFWYSLRFFGLLSSQNIGGSSVSDVIYLSFLRDDYFSP